jgi:hypothetical protein
VLKLAKICDGVLSFSSSARGAGTGLIPDLIEVQFLDTLNPTRRHIRRISATPS